MPSNGEKLDCRWSVGCYSKEQIYQKYLPKILLLLFIINNIVQLEKYMGKRTQCYSNHSWIKFGWRSESFRDSV